MRHHLTTAIVIASLWTLPSETYAVGVLDRGNINMHRGGALGSPSLNKQLEQERLKTQLSARDAIAIAERRYGGRAVGAKKIPSASGTAYKVRILQDNGKVRNVIIDGK